MGADRPHPGWEQKADRRDRAAERRERPTDPGQLGRFEQAAVERAQLGYVPTLGGPSYRRVQAARGQAQQTTEAAARATARLVERVIQVKQGELAAHLANSEAHEQLASLQEALGHPERAADARAKAEQARDLHRAAGAELAEYRARIKAVEDRRARRRREGTGRAGG